MSRPISIALNAAGMLVVVIMTPIVAVTGFRLIRMVLFSGTLDGSLVAFILLLALLPAGIGLALFGYFLYQQIRRTLHGGPIAERDYIGRFLERRVSEGEQ